jgi:hypothetical protein
MSWFLVNDWNNSISGVQLIGYELVNIKLKFTLEQAAKAQRRSRGKALFFL